MSKKRETVQVRVWIPNEIHKEIKAQAARNEATIPDWIVRILVNHCGLHTLVTPK